MSRLTGPYDPERVQAASVDLTLGEEVRRYKPTWDDRRHEHIIMLDVHKENPTVSMQLEEGTGMWLYPKLLYLMHTRERLHTLKYEIDVTGKSSLGRLGIIVHHTAGHIDPGFDGQVTLEVAVIHPVKIYGGMPFCQARFHTLEGEVEDYRKRGNYVGDAARGAQASRSWKQS